MHRTEIHFVIDRDGNIQSTIKGIKGSGCGTLAAEIEKLGRVAKLERTQEFHERCSGQSSLLNLVNNKNDPSNL
jgi:Protein of unknown function (DUF2997)